jgi:Kef-type K+ transport system membrane component KefB
MSVETVVVSPPASSPSRTLIGGYIALLLVAIGLFFAIRAVGANLDPPTHPPQVAATKSGSPHLLPHLLGAICTVVAASRLLGTIFLKLGQPRVIGEVIAGILLGPTLLGRISPEATAFLFPPSIMPILSGFAQLGVILYMFLVGLELNLDLLRSKAHSTIAISHSSIVVPFILGALIALGLFTHYAPGEVSFTSFALFMGIAMSITAFPVLARILTDQKLDRTELGVLALSCAAADDVTAWCLLAFVVGVTKAQLGAALTTLVLSAAFIIFMVKVVRPATARWWGPTGQQTLTGEATALLLGGVLVSALTTELIGIHALFGAFLLGAIIPHDGVVPREVRGKIDDFVSILLLPLFFAYTGMRTEIGLLSQGADWLVCGLIIVTATAGKFGGSLIAARLTGLDWRLSTSLGVLMNTRGLMELIVLNIGLDLGVISPILFAMMVIMALVTTMATAPLLRLLKLQPEPTPS